MVNLTTYSTFGDCGLGGRYLFLVIIVLALGLAALVILAPWLDVESGSPGWNRLFTVFAGDTLVRRTALASAAGLLVTAFVFFRRGRLPQDAEPRP